MTDAAADAPQQAAVQLDFTKSYARRRPDEPRSHYALRMNFVKALVTNEGDKLSDERIEVLSHCFSNYKYMKNKYHVKIMEYISKYDPSAPKEVDVPKKREGEEGEEDEDAPDAKKQKLGSDDPNDPLAVKVNPMVGDGADDWEALDKEWEQDQANDSGEGQTGEEEVDYDALDAEGEAEEGDNMEVDEEEKKPEKTASKPGSPKMKAESKPGSPKANGKTASKPGSPKGSKPGSPKHSPKKLDSPKMKATASK